MSSKKLNKILNKLIVFLIIAVIGLLGKEKILDKQEEKTPNTNIVDSKLEIYFFDVGQADSILIKEKDYTMLIDGGNQSDGENLVKYLQEELNVNEDEIHEENEYVKNQFDY